MREPCWCTIVRSVVVGPRRALFVQDDLEIGWRMAHGQPVLCSYAQGGGDKPWGTWPLGMRVQPTGKPMSHSQNSAES